MLRSIFLFTCVFLTSSFNSAWADYCFQNANAKQVLPPLLCFQEIKILNFGKSTQRLYIRNDDIDQAYPIKSITNSGYNHMLVSEGDFVNYTEKCGLTLLSTFVLKATFNYNGDYVHSKTNAVTIKFQHSPNNCDHELVSGSEMYLAK